MIIRIGRTQVARIERALKERLPIDVEELRELLADARKKLGRVIFKRALKRSRAKEKARGRVKSQDSVIAR